MPRCAFWSDLRSMLLSRLYDPGRQFVGDQIFRGVFHIFGDHVFNVGVVFLQRTIFELDRRFVDDCDFHSGRFRCMFLFSRRFPGHYLYVFMGFIPCCLERRVLHCTYSNIRFCNQRNYFGMRSSTSVDVVYRRRNLGGSS